MARITRKSVQVELTFQGDGSIVQTAPGVFAGGVQDPVLQDNATFQVWREVLNEDGVLNPIVGEPSYKGALQISIEATSSGYRELGRYLLAIAELDASADPDFHEHHEVVSSDGRTSLHIIVRKPPSLVTG